MTRSAARRWIAGAVLLLLLAALVVIRTTLVERSGHASHGPAASAEAERSAARPARERARQSDGDGEQPESHAGASAADGPLASTDRTLAVVVTDAFGDAIVGARVWLQAERDGDPAEVGATGDEGVVTAPLSSDTEIAYAVTHAEFARAVGTVRPHAARTEVRVLLGTGAFVLGRVERLDGSAPSETVTVVAWERGTPPPESSTGGVATAYSRRAVAAADGSFRVGPFPAGAAIALAAVAPGYVSIAPEPSAEAGGARVTVAVAPLYAVVAFLSWEGAGPPLASFPTPTLQGASEAGLRPVAEARLVAQHVAPVLSRQETSAQDSGRSVRWLFCGENEAVSVGPLELRAWFPGYRPVRAAVRAHRLVGDAIHVHRVELEALDDVRAGSVRVRLERPGGVADVEAQDAGASLHVATVRLERRTGDGERGGWIEAYLHVPPGAVEQIDGVPEGDYDVGLSVPGPRDDWSITPEVVTVTGGEVSEVIVQGPATCGSLLIASPRIAFGSRSARLSLFTRSPDRPGERVDHRVFRGPPFLFPMLAPGIYRVEGYLGGRRHTATRVRVTAGEQTVLDLFE